MKTIFKRTLLAIAMTGLVTTSALAAPISSKPLTGSQINGYIPYMESIGTRMVVGGLKDGQGNWTGLEVGDVIDIPSHLTAAQLTALGLENNFILGDKDGDPKAAKAGEFTINGVTYPGSKEFDVKWYAIEPAEGKTWETVASWEDVVPTELDGAFYDENQNSKSLIVPAEAAGKRIGFIATPTTETGVPFQGVPVKAWDLSKIWNQTPPTEPGECEPGTPGCSDNGTPGVDNPGGGGGDVGAPAGVVTIYDGKTNKLVKPGDALFVDRTYYATIQIKDGAVYREPTTTELETLAWNITSSTDGTVVASYKAGESTRVSTTANGQAATGFNKYEFTTQKTNADALDDLKVLAPNYSEQGFSLSVTLDSNVN